MKPYFVALASVLLALATVSCQKKEEKPFSVTPYELPQPIYFPTKTNIPADNPITEEGVALGKKLFYDNRLCGRSIPDTVMCCASCHHRNNNFEIGGDLTNTHHVMLPLVNLAWNTTGLGWNGAVKSIEEMVFLAVTASDEINGDTAQIVSVLQNTDDYPLLFSKAFGSERITFIGIQRAIAQYVRSLVSYGSKFDRYLNGEVMLSQDEMQGYMLFITEEGADCFHCHGGGSNALFTTHLFYNNGLDSVFNDPMDRFAVTGDPMDRGAYKVPTLRNITRSGPYMHDGRFKTLDEVIDFYSEGVHNTAYTNPLMHHAMENGVQLTEQEKQQLKAFLKTLDDEGFLNETNHE